MTALEQLREQKRAMVVDIVDALTESRGKKMSAYKALGDIVGKSSTYVRRIISRDPAVRIDHHVALKIRDLHDRLCVRVARAADAAEARNALLQEQIDAAVRSSGAAGLGLDGASVASTATPRGTGPALLPAHAFARTRTAPPAQSSLELNDLPLFQATAAPR